MIILILWLIILFTLIVNGYTFLALLWIGATVSYFADLATRK